MTAIYALVAKNFSTDKIYLVTKGVVKEIRI